VTQKQRFFALVVDLGVLVSVSWVILGVAAPPLGSEGLWFYAGVMSILFGDLLATPFFRRPVDTLAAGIAVAIAIAPIAPESAEPAVLMVRVVVLVLAGAAVLTSVVAILFRDESGEPGAGTAAYELAKVLGAPRLLFSGVFVYSILAFTSTEPANGVWIALAWVLTVFVHPGEWMVGLFGRLVTTYSNSRPAIERVGSIAVHESPRLLAVRCELVSDRSSRLFLAPAEDGYYCLAVELEPVGYSSGVWIRALELRVSETARSLVHDRALGSGLSHSNGDVAVVRDAELLAIARQDPAFSKRSEVIGLVSEDTTLDMLHVELLETVPSSLIEQGALLGAAVGDTTVLYQVVSASVRGEALENRNRHGFVEVLARRVGEWDESAGRFLAVKWLPSPNTPVFLHNSLDSHFNPEAIGVIPGTSYTASLDTTKAVLYNTAILGILGVGKSCLAFEVVERAIAQGVRVLCLDVTGQWASEMGPVLAPQNLLDSVGALKAIGAAGRTKVAQNVEEGGSVREFKEQAARIVGQFLSAATAPSLLTIDPSQFEVWRQESKMFKDSASMASLTPAEITRIFAEAVLSRLMGCGIVGHPRCWLVLEEAHTLVPEWNSVVAEGDKTATNGTARAILQGRKYGLGCLLITQRTANVTKTILNQCHTVFAMRSFDATGMDYMANYIGRDYASVLSTLDDRHAVLFGRASSSKDPVLIVSNDRDAYLACARSTPLG